MVVTTARRLVRRIGAVHWGSGTKRRDGAVLGWFLRRMSLVMIYVRRPGPVAPVEFQLAGKLVDAIAVRKVMVCTSLPAGGRLVRGGRTVVAPSLCMKASLALPRRLSAQCCAYHCPRCGEMRAARGASRCRPRRATTPAPTVAVVPRRHAAVGFLLHTAVLWSVDQGRQ